MTTPASTERASPLRQVWSDPLYRGGAIAMFLSGLGTSAAAPQIVLFLVKELDASLAVAGLLYLTNLAAPFAGYVVGGYSDRSGNRLGLFRLCALAGFLGWAVIAVSTTVWMPFVVSVLVLSFSGSAASQIFATIHDDLRQKEAGANESVVAIVRMALTAGWVVGPVLGTWMTAELGLRWMLWGTALCLLAQMVPLAAVRVPPPSRPAGQSGAATSRGPSPRSMLPLLAFTGCFVLIYLGEPVKYGFLLIHMEDNLQIDPTMRGIVIGIQPLVELLIMPFSVVLGGRVGMIRLMGFAAVLGVVANICFAVGGGAAAMLIGQILMGGVWGVFMALGIIVAQRLLPDAVATASAIFMNSTAFSRAVGGAAGSMGISLLGLPGVFFIPAAFAVFAVLGLALIARTGIVKS